MAPQSSMIINKTYLLFITSWLVGGKSGCKRCRPNHRCVVGTVYSLDRSVQWHVDLRLGEALCDDCTESTTVGHSPNETYRGWRVTLRCGDEFFAEDGEDFFLKRVRDISPACIGEFDSVLTVLLEEVVDL